MSSITGRLSNVGLVLTILAHCFVFATFAKEIPYYQLVKTKEIRSANLMDELSKPLEPLDLGTNLKVSVGKQVALILARAGNKRKKNLILGEFSIDDLLALNRVSIEDCHVDRLAERRQFCKDKFENKHTNLHLYCTKTNTNLFDWCNYRIDKLIEIALIKLSKTKTAEKLRDMIRKLAKLQTKKIKKAADIGDVTPDEVFNAIQAKKGDSFKAKVATVCEPLEAALNLNFEIKLKDEPINFKMDHWVDFLRYCQATNKISPPIEDKAQTEDGHAEEDDDDLDEEDLDEEDENGY